MKLCGFEVGLKQPFFLIAGPCVIESEQLQMDTAGALKDITRSLGIPFIFKSSFDKANRSSGSSFRGPGQAQGLEILAKVKRELQVPVLTDVHSEDQIAAVAAVVARVEAAAVVQRRREVLEEDAGEPVAAAVSQTFPLTTTRMTLLSNRMMKRVCKEVTMKMSGIRN